MKTILISIKPKYVADIINGKKTIEIRKSMPKCDLPIDVYIYCTKEKDKNLYMSMFHGNYQVAKNVDHKHHIINGKVVAKFTLNKVEEIRPLTNLNGACISYVDMKKYLNNRRGYAWHIDNLVIFDKPKELSEFYHSFHHNKHERRFANNNVEIDSQYKALRQPIRGGYEYVYPLTKAPQSWCYVEV